MFSDRAIPRLARRVRLRWDAARAAHVLLVPEGVLMLNESAAEVLRLVDGVRTVRDVASALCASHPEQQAAELLDDVQGLLVRLASRGFVEGGGVSP